MLDESAPQQDCVLALDVGGTSMKGAVLDRTLNSIASLRASTPRAHGPDAVVDAVADFLRFLQCKARDRDLIVRHAGVVVPGIVDEARGTAVYAANLGWRDAPLAAELARRTGLDVTLGHDVRAGGMAECTHGAARGARNALFVALGTGVAAAVVCDGVAVTSGGYAGELGHLVVDPQGRPCPCGGTGCLETVASASAVVAGYNAVSKRPVAGAVEVAALARRGDALAEQVWNRAVEALAQALAATTTLLAPEKVVLGGGLSEAGPLLVDRVRAALSKRLTFQRHPLVVQAALGDRAGSIGAGIAAWNAVGVDTSAARPASRMTSDSPSPHVFNDFLQVAEPGC
ncbi:ROK family protein [Streptomyces sp. NPDC094447]|uniref:ROK family protein n=1 Tax=Streptomyces sp. NPDC094447 TaxID=3366062 RepID=UPI003818350B